jgi:hypothetical protein
MSRSIGQRVIHDAFLVHHPNGWILWKTEGGELLNDLFQRLQASNHSDGPYGSGT